MFSNISGPHKFEVYCSHGRCLVLPKLNLNLEAGQLQHERYISCKKKTALFPDNPAASVLPGGPSSVLPSTCS